MKQQEFPPTILVAAVALSLFCAVTASASDQEWKWQGFATPSAATDFLNGKTDNQDQAGRPLADAEIAVIGDGEKLSFLVFGQPDPKATDDDPPARWAFASADGTEQALAFLNGSQESGGPISLARIGAAGSAPRFFIFFKREPGPATKLTWTVKQPTSISDAHNFLRGVGTYTVPAGNPQVCAINRDKGLGLFVFHQGSAASAPGLGSWRWKNLAAAESVHSFLNGTGSPKQAVAAAKIAAASAEGVTEILVFFSRAGSATSRPNMNIGYGGAVLTALKGVRLYEHEGYRGRNQFISADDPDLGEGRIGSDTVSSLRVTRGCSITLFEKINFKGASQVFSGSTAKLAGTEIDDDRASSVKVKCD